MAATDQNGQENSWANPCKVNDYECVREKVFWQELYRNGGTETLYCGKEFKGPSASDGSKGTLAGREVWVEHVYAQSWIKAHFSHCKHQNKCAGAGDLHNLWPAIRNINSSRGNLPFGEIPGEQSKQFRMFCPDFERTYASDVEIPMVEPRDSAKGDVARSILYMMNEYRLPVPEYMDCGLLLKWHKEDPPDAHERWRNEEIFRLQDTRNHWISGADRMHCRP